jgi:hypothetical protein
VKKVALFAFNGEAMCFVHVLLNALDFHAKGYDTKIVLEGASVKLVPLLDVDGSPFKGLFAKCREAGLMAGVCLACAKKLGTFDAAEALGLPMLGDMSGHAGMEPFTEQGYEIITF